MHEACEHSRRRIPVQSMTRCIPRSVQEQQLNGVCSSSSNHEYLCYVTNDDMLYVTPPHKAAINRCLNWSSELDENVT